MIVARASGLCLAAAGTAVILDQTVSLTLSVGLF
jgi:hypothetical protein